MQSFRSQLAMRATVVVIVGVSLVSVATVLTLRAILDREIDASLLNIAAIQAASLADGPSGEIGDVIGLGQQSCEI